MKIYLLSVTHDDGAHWHTLSCLGYFMDENRANLECIRRNNAPGNGELTRWEVKTCDEFGKF